MENITSNNDKDLNPTQSNEPNERFEDVNLNKPQSDEQNTSDEGKKKGIGAREMDEQTNTSGYGSSQRRATDIASGSVGPLDSDLSELPSQKRRNRR